MMDIRRRAPLLRPIQKFLDLKGDDRGVIFELRHG
jgi:hypothetical protein